MEKTQKSIEPHRVGGGWGFEQAEYTRGWGERKAGGVEKVKKESGIVERRFYSSQPVRK